jgi:hypothetical protein
MKRTSTIIFFVMLTTCLTLVTSGMASARTRTSSKPIRIRFLPGAISVQARGQLTKNRNADAFYVIKAKSGDHMIVNIIPLSPGLMTSGDVTSPSGAQDGQHGGIIFNGELTETGDYTIRVARNLMGTQRPDGSFLLEVVITPEYLKN